MRYSVIFLGITLLVAACGGGTLRQADDIDIGDTLYTIEFEETNDFETGRYEQENASLSIEDGRYIIEQSGDRSVYIWGQGGEAAQNVSVQATAQAASEYKNDLFGVMCRVNEDGAGYAFMISSDGFASIARTDGGSLTFILDWIEYDSFNPEGENTIQGVCVDDYLAIFVNGELIGDVTNDRYPEGGQVGLLVGLFIEGVDETASVRVEFDDLTVSEASIK